MTTHSPLPWDLNIHTGDGQTIGPNDDWSISAPDGTVIVHEAGSNPNAHRDVHLLWAAPAMYTALKGFQIKGPDASGNLFVSLQRTPKIIGFKVEADSETGRALLALKALRDAAVDQAETPPGPARVPSIRIAGKPA